SLPVPGDHRLRRGASDYGGKHHARPVVTVEERPLRGDPVRHGAVLHVCHLRRALCGYAEQQLLVDLVVGRPGAGGQHHLPHAGEVRHAVAGILARDRRDRRRVRMGSRATRPRRRGGLLMAPIIAADHLSKWYGQVIGLNDVSVTVPSGVTGLLGPNGAGKSTFMKLVTGQLKPSKGSIQVLGEPIWGNPALY